jgi:hypothetical protein
MATSSRCLKTFSYAEIPATLAATGKHFALKIKEPSMYPYYLKGDTVIVRVQSEAQDSDMVVDHPHCLQSVGIFAPLLLSQRDYYPASESLRSCKWPLVLMLCYLFYLSLPLIHYV